MNHPTRHTQRGGALMEALIAMLIIAFGALGFVGLQARTAVLNLEGYQRAQALQLLKDMEQRMLINRAQAASYVAAEIPAKDNEDCTVKPTVAERDRCEWAALIAGAAEKSGTTSVGAVTYAFGCITSLAPLQPNTYQISLVWQGVQKSAESNVDCAKDKFPAGSEALRRGVSTVVRFGTLL
ncbi:type IV pilus modification protein PilV [Ramlibacter sp. AW1]|uniref:Type IV pilus modification protein PilV n=1 Tax=Ramlibacter aurantiacus TaxID=2801330 RepID=A0A936ZK57_9BURK|nr:type IV pilus modification protein PilV [Ramlibacter aurantiacus]MBL0422829.1 type IV pilus modification protein PilV [Ramlibacter aurantiacus]